MVMRNVISFSTIHYSFRFFRVGVAGATIEYRTQSREKCQHRHVEYVCTSRIGAIICIRDHINVNKNYCLIKLNYGIIHTSFFGQSMDIVLN